MSAVHPSPSSHCVLVVQQPATSCEVHRPVIRSHVFVVQGSPSSHSLLSRQPTSGASSTSGAIETSAASSVPVSFAASKTSTETSGRNGRSGVVAESPDVVRSGCESEHDATTRRTSGTGVLTSERGTRGVEQVSSCVAMPSQGYRRAERALRCR